MTFIILYRPLNEPPLYYGPFPTRAAAVAWVNSQEPAFIFEIHELFQPAEGPPAAPEEISSDV